jgi:hypothetical protein
VLPLAGAPLGQERSTTVVKLHGSYRPGRARGASDLAIVVLVGAVLVLALAGWASWSAARGAARNPLAAGTGEPEQPALAEEQGPAEPGVRDPEALQSESPIEVGIDLPYKRMEKSFDGRGTLTGSVAFAPGLPTPHEWTLEVLPSQFALGREHAEGRTETFPGNITTFELFDLPMGGYTVRASAESMSSLGVEVMLFKLAEQPHLPGMDRVHLSLVMMPRASLDGVVLDHWGQPAAEVLVTLQRKGGPERREARTTFSGLWRFQDLEEGTWIVRVGPFLRPLVEPLEVTVARPATQAPDLQLPPLYPVVLRAVDETDRPLEGAVVRGFGPTPIEEVTGFDGQLLLGHLAVGTYQVRVQEDGTARAGRLDFEVRPLEQGQEPPLFLVRCLERD